MDTIFYHLHGASDFGKIDLFGAYYQIEHDEGAKDMCTINTSQGLFEMCRLPLGLIPKMLKKYEAGFFAKGTSSFI